MRKVCARMCSRIPVTGDSDARNAGLSNLKWWLKRSAAAAACCLHDCFKNPPSTTNLLPLSHHTTHKLLCDSQQLPLASIPTHNHTQNNHTTPQSCYLASSRLCRSHSGHAALIRSSRKKQRHPYSIAAASCCLLPTTQTKHQVQRALLLDVVVRQCPAVLQLLTRED